MKALIPSDVETSRMRLHRMGPEHFEHLKGFWADPLVCEYTFVNPLDEEQAWLTLAANVGHWAMRGYGLYCAFEKLSGDFIGTIGLWNPPSWPEPEYVCALRPEYWGGRYGIEGGRKFIDLVHRQLGWSTLVSVVRQDNEKSMRGLARLGAKFDRTVTLSQSQWSMYRLFSAESTTQLPRGSGFHHAFMPVSRA